LGGSGTQAGNRNGASNGNDGQKGADALGGGICNSALIPSSTARFFGNQVKGGNGGNGGNGDFTAGKGGNGGNGYGGGLYSTAFVGVTNCTFSGNGANGGTNGVTGTVGNPSANGSPGLSREGDNISNNGGTFRFKNSILAKAPTASAPLGSSLIKATISVPMAAPSLLKRAARSAALIILARNLPPWPITAVPL